MHHFDGLVIVCRDDHFYRVVGVNVAENNVIAYAVGVRPYVGLHSVGFVDDA